MGRHAIKLALAAVLAVMACGCTTVPLSVGSIPNQPRSYVAPQTHRLIYQPPPALPTTDDVADVPPGYVSFCIRFADQCQATAERPQLDPADRHGMADDQEGQCERQRRDLARRRS